VALFGPEELTFDQMAEALTAVLGRPVTFSEMSMTTIGELLRSMGTSAGMVCDSAHMMTTKNAGVDSIHLDASRRDTPTIFRNWVEAELWPAIPG
jgi:uncharacterized protein YbjT (DUF2867 family)